MVLPESPMNFQWGEDPDFQRYIGAFAARNNVSVLFNSAEPDAKNNKYFNSAVMIDRPRAARWPSMIKSTSCRSAKPFPFRSIA